MKCNNSYVLIVIFLTYSALTRAQAPGSMAIYGGSLGAVAIPTGNSQTDNAETIYIGPGTYTINGTWDIYSKNIWVSYNAAISGTGQIVIHNSADVAGAGGVTNYDGNTYGGNNFLNVNVVISNNAGVQLLDLPYPTDPVASTWFKGVNMFSMDIGKDLNLAVDGANISLGATLGSWGILALSPSATISNYSAFRMIITHDHTYPFVSKDGGGVPYTFTFPFGITVGDYTPMTLTSNTGASINTSVVSYSNPEISPYITSPQNGMDRAWYIWSSPDAVSSITLQHNSPMTDGSAYVDATAYITNIIDWYSAPNWSTSSTSDFVSTGVHTSAAPRTIPIRYESNESFFTKTSSQLIPLPLRLLTFEVSKKNNDAALLQWVTASEQSIAGFGIERSDDGKSWEKIGNVASKSASGNSATGFDYNFVDAKPKAGQNYYRLKQVDIDGKFEYSTVVASVFDALGTPVSIYPNPAVNSVRLDGVLDGQTVTIYDIAGRRVQFNKMSNGLHTIDLTSLPPGLYQFAITDILGSVLSRERIIKITTTE